MAMGLPLCYILVCFLYTAMCSTKERNFVLQAGDDRRSFLKSHWYNTSVGFFSLVTGTFHPAFAVLEDVFFLFLGMMEALCHRTRRMKLAAMTLHCINFIKLRVRANPAEYTEMLDILRSFPLGSLLFADVPSIASRIDINDMNYMAQCSAQASWYLKKGRQPPTSSSMELQAGEDEEEEDDGPGGLFGLLTSFFKNFSRLVEGPFFRQAFELIMAICAVTLWWKKGDKFKKDSFLRTHEELKKCWNFSTAWSTIKSVLGSIEFLCTKGYHMYTTGSTAPFFYGSDRMQKLIDDINDFSMAMKHAANLDVLNTTYKKEEETARRLIEELAAVKSLAVGDTASLKAVAHYEKILKEADMALKLILRSKTARKAPFSILVYSPPGTGKSLVTNVIVGVLNRVLGLSGDPRNVWTKNSKSEYNDGFTSTCEIAVLDDVASIHPQAGEMDQSLANIIDFINNVPHSPVMADVVEKGKNTFKAAGVIVTSNVKDLHAKKYFSSPMAVLRRLKYVLTIVVKDEYAKPRQDLHEHKMLNQDIVRYLEYDGDPDFWDLKFEEVSFTANGDPRYREIMNLRGGRITDIHEFVGKLAELIKKHDEEQEAYLESVMRTQGREYCDKCFVHASHCQCVDDGNGLELQAGDEIVQALTVGNFVFMIGVLYITSHIYNTFVAMLPLVGSLIEVHSRTSAFFGYFGSMYRYITRDPREVLLRMVRRNTNKKLLGIAALVAVGGVVYLALKRVCMSLQSKDEPKVDTNPWAAKEGLTANVPRRSGCQNTSTGLAAYKRVLGFATYACKAHYTDPEGNRRMVSFQAVKYKGTRFICNTHSLWKLKGLMDFRLDMANRWQRFSIHTDHSKFFHVEDRDVSFFDVVDAQPGADLIGNDFNKSYFVGEGHSQASQGYMMKVAVDDDGIIGIDEVMLTRIAFNITTDVGDLGRGKFHMAKPDSKTGVGTCGAMYVATTGAGPAVCGFHVAADDHSVVAIPLTWEFMKLQDAAFVQWSVSTRSTYTLEGGHIDSAPAKGYHGLFQYDKHLGELHPKSPINFTYGQPGIVSSIGSILNDDGSRYTRATMKSRVTESAGFGYFSEKGFSADAYPPVMSGWRPKASGIAKMMHFGKKWDHAVLEESARGYFDDVKDVGGTTFKLDDIVNVNGHPTLDSINPIDLSTSAGFPYNCPKKELSTWMGCDERGRNVYDFDPKIWVVTEAMERHYLKGGDTYGPVFTATFKDEPVKREKRDNADTRIIYASPLPFTILVRRYFLSLISVVSANKYKFESAVGMVACNAEWTELFDFITAFGEDRIVAGDYKGFDVRVMDTPLIKSIFTVILELNIALGDWSEDDVTVMKGIVWDLIYASVDFFGDFYVMCSINPSGQSLTTLVNCVGNSILYRYAYKLVTKSPVSTFQENIHLMTYGDDSIAGVSPDCSFTHQGMSLVMGEIGITYTDSQKTGKVVHLSHISEVDFLKRGFVRSSDDDFIRAPLSMKSIHRMLLVQVRSKSLAPQLQMVETMRSAHLESYQHGREVFNKFDRLIKDYVQQHKLGEFMKELPTYEAYTFARYGI